MTERERRELREKIDAAKRRRLEAAQSAATYERQLRMLEDEPATVERYGRRKYEFRELK